ncbi:uracil-DNA glycosylase family protein [Sandarakinorhabdus sp. DWP1-3-1]|uniref:uracil-DNA glycosylase family protein n=1 Tax=Sandarakinorhabdus sp. DWP1-3-1 TaxID=2804627 RepID=UPI003CE97A07
MTVVRQGNMNIGDAEGVSALAWLVTAGADALVTDTPRNWLAAPPVPRPVQRPAAAIAAPAATARTAAPAAATALADAAMDLPALASAVAEYSHPLRRPGLVPQLWRGEPGTAVAILCDQPEEPGSPAALLRERMLAAIGLAPADHATGHVVPWPLARAPRAEEATTFAPFLARAIALARPRCILALGQAASSVAGDPRGIASLRGNWLAAAGIPLLATFHPRQLLAQPELKRLAWADLQTFAARIESR